MSTAGETLYAYRTPYPDVFQAGRDCVATFPVYRDGALVMPSACTMRLLAPDGQQVAAPVVDLSGDVPTVTILGTELDPDDWPWGEGYTEVWVPTLEGAAPREVDRPACLAKRSIYPVITDSDLLGRYPTLLQVMGSAATSLQPFIDDAYKSIIARLITAGHLPYLNKDAWALREPHMELTMSRFLMAQHLARPTANFLELAKTHQAQYEALWGSISFRTDPNQDGLVDDPDRRSGVGGTLVHRNQSPRGYRGRRRDVRW